MISGLAGKLRRGISSSVTGLAALFISSCGNVNSDDGGNDSSGNDDYVGNPYLNNNDNFGNDGNSGGGNSGNSGGFDDFLNGGLDDGNFGSGGQSEVKGNLIPGFYAGEAICDFYFKNSRSGKEILAHTDSYSFSSFEVDKNGFPLYYNGQKPRIGLKYRPLVDVPFSNNAEIIEVSDNLIGFSFTSRNLFVSSSLQDTFYSFEENGDDWSFDGRFIDFFANADYDDPQNNLYEGDLVILNVFEGKGSEFEYSYNTYDSVRYECKCISSQVSDGG